MSERAKSGASPKGASTLPGPSARVRHNVRDRSGLAELCGQGSVLSLVAWIGLGLSSVVTICVAAWLDPSAAGQGTHTQLGLPPCSFLVVTGLPCPGCGLTTAMASMAHLDIALAWSANPAGGLLFVVVLALAPLSVVGVAKRLPVLSTLACLRGDIVCFAVAASTLCVWLCALAMAAF